MLNPLGWCIKALLTQGTLVAIPMFSSDVNSQCIQHVIDCFTPQAFKSCKCSWYSISGSVGNFCPHFGHGTPWVCCLTCWHILAFIIVAYSHWVHNTFFRQCTLDWCELSSFKLLKECEQSSHTYGQSVGCWLCRCLYNAIPDSNWILHTGHLCGIDWLLDKIGTTGVTSSTNKVSGLVCSFSESRWSGYSGMDINGLSICLTLGSRGGLQQQAPPQKSLWTSFSSTQGTKSV